MLPSLSQVIPKLTDFEVILRDRALCDLWVEDKLERVSAHSQMMTLVSQIEDIVGDSVEVFRLPEGIELRPVRAGEVRLVRDDGEPLLYDKKRWL